MTSQLAIGAFASMLCATTGTAFVVAPPLTCFQCTRHSSSHHNAYAYFYHRQQPQLCASKNKEDDSTDQSSSSSDPLFDAGSDASSVDLPANFNPFKPVETSSSLPSGGLPSPGQPVSLRAMRMKAITGELYNCNNTPAKMRSILEENERFLLEQLVDMECVLDVDSIYSIDMGPAERRKTYREVMEERVNQARSEEARRVLVALRDFVLEKAEQAAVE